MIDTDKKIRHLINCQLLDFIDRIEDEKADVERSILNHVHIAYKRNENIIIVDYKYVFPALCNQIANIRRAVYKANML